MRRQHVAVIRADKPARQRLLRLPGEEQQCVRRHLRVAHEEIERLAVPCAVKYRHIRPALLHRWRRRCVNGGPRLFPRLRQRGVAPVFHAEELPELACHRRPGVRPFVHAVRMPFGVYAVAKADGDCPFAPRPVSDECAERGYDAGYLFAERFGCGGRTHHALGQVVVCLWVCEACRVADRLVRMPLAPFTHFPEHQKDLHPRVRRQFQQPPGLPVEV